MNEISIPVNHIAVVKTTAGVDTVTLLSIWGANFVATMNGGTGLDFAKSVFPDTPITILDMTAHNPQPMWAVPPIGSL